MTNASYGRCANLDSCSLAARRKDIVVPLGHDFICPECSQRLIPPPLKASGGGSLLVILLLLLVLGGAGAAVMLKPALLARLETSLRSLAPAKPAAPAAPTPAPAAAASPAALSPGSASPGSASPGSASPASPSVPAAPSAAPPAPAAAPPATTPPATTPPATTQPVPAATAAAPGPATASPAPAAALPVQPNDILFHLAGSDIIGAEVAPQLVAAYLAQSGDTDIRTVPAAAAGQTLVIGQHNGRPEAVEIDITSTAEGFAHLAAGSAQVAMAPRQATPAEREQLSALGDMNTPAAEHVAGVDGLVVVSNAANRLRALSKTQLRGLLAGQITDWSQAGATPGPVAIYSRDRNTETGAVIAALTGATPSAAVHDLPDDAAIAAAVSNDPHGIGIMTLPPLMLHSRYAVQVRPLAIADTGAAAISPSNRPAVATLDYPYAFRLYLYIAERNVAPAVKRFIDFADSRDGEAVVDSLGLISQSVAPQELILPDSVSERFRAYVEGAKLLAVHFRFQTNSTNLDVASQRDLDRVTNFLVSNRYTGDNLILAGFADNTGNAALNVALSQKRAQALAALLSARGLKPARVSGFGAELPLADNGTEEGRERNRRVEVYLLP